MKDYQAGEVRSDDVEIIEVDGFEHVFGLSFFSELWLDQIHL